MRTFRPNHPRAHHLRASRIPALLLRALLGARYATSPARAAWFVALAARVALIDATTLRAYCAAAGF